jgi:rhodanese-related sulfurtransferase
MFENIPNLLFAVAAVAAVGFVVFNTLGGALGGPNAEEQEQLRASLAAGEAELVDVRTPREYAGGAVDGAKNIPVQQLEQRLDEVGAKDKPVAVYCRSGNRSGRAERILEEAGFEKVYDLGSFRSASKIVQGAN